MAEKSSGEDLWSLGDLQLETAAAIDADSNVHHSAPPTTLSNAELSKAEAAKSSEDFHASAEEKPPSRPTSQQGRRHDSRPNSRTSVHLIEQDAAGSEENEAHTAGESSEEEWSDAEEVGSEEEEELVEEELVDETEIINEIIAERKGVAEAILEEGEEIEDEEEAALLAEDLANKQLLEQERFAAASQGTPLPPLPDWERYYTSALPYSIGDDRFKDGPTFNPNPPVEDPTNKIQVRNYNLIRGAEPTTKEFELPQLVYDPKRFISYFAASDGGIMVAGFKDRREEGIIKAGGPVVVTTGSNPDLIEICHAYATEWGRDLGAAVGNLAYESPEHLVDLSERGVGFYHDGHGERYFLMTDSQRQRPILLETLQLVYEGDPLRWMQAEHAMDFVAIKKGAESVTQHAAVACTNEIIMSRLRPHQRYISSFNSTDREIKCPIRAKDMFEGAPDRIQGEENATTFAMWFGANWSADGSTSPSVCRKNESVYWSLALSMSFDNPYGADIVQEILGRGNIQRAVKHEVLNLERYDGKPGWQNAGAVRFRSAADIRFVADFLLGRSVPLWDPKAKRRFMSPALGKPVCIGKIFKLAVILDFCHLYRNPKWADDGSIRMDLDKLVKIGAMRKVAGRWTFDLFAFVKDLRETWGIDIKVPDWEY